MYYNQMLVDHAPAGDCSGDCRTCGNHAVNRGCASTPMGDLAAAIRGQQRRQSLRLAAWLAAQAAK